MLEACATDPHASGRQEPQSARAPDPCRARRLAHPSGEGVADNPPRGASQRLLTAARWECVPARQEKNTRYPRVVEGATGPSSAGDTVIAYVPCS